MRKILLSFLLVIVTAYAPFAQKKQKDTLKLFKDERLIEAKMVTNMKKLLYSKRKPAYQDAQLVFTLPDSSRIDEKITIRTRGVFRRENCYIPSLKLNFQNPGAEKLAPLKELKMVCACETGDVYDQLVLKEYLIYKMYNMLTDKSFKVRLLNLTIEDSEGDKKPVSQHAFLIEDVDKMADRNKCKEFSKRMMQENTDREQMTLVTLFQYMIGNTDWEVANFHNIKLIAPKKDSTHKPYAVPYDFDFAGLVNANYATPNPASEMKYVTDRWYMGYSRSMEELQAVIKIFMDQKENILNLIDGFEPLNKLNKKDAKAYINEFYDQISSKGFAKRTFIDYARSAP